MTEYIVAGVKQGLLIGFVYYITSLVVAKIFGIIKYSMKGR